MGWVALSNGMSCEQAQEIAKDNEMMCVSLAPPKVMYNAPDIRPIVSRSQWANRWYNYYEDGTYRTTLYKNSKGEAPLSYAPYHMVPDKANYLDLVTFFKTHLDKYKGKYWSYILYVTGDVDEVVYSMGHGLIYSPLHTIFDNTELTFEVGRPRVKIRGYTNEYAFVNEDVNRTE